ncbi:MAG TPA: TonB family protein [Rhodopila sp.]|nr:TonB family protein [Rhodopila sp.]
MPVTGVSFGAHLLILLALLLIAPTPRLGDPVPEPATVGFVFAPPTAAQPQVRAPEPAREPPRPEPPKKEQQAKSAPPEVEPEPEQADTAPEKTPSLPAAVEPAPRGFDLPIPSPDAAAEPQPPRGALTQDGEGHEKERVPSAKTHRPPTKTTRHARPSTHRKPIRREKSHREEPARAARPHPEPRPKVNPKPETTPEPEAEHEPLVRPAPSQAVPQPRAITPPVPPAPPPRVVTPSVPAARQPPAAAPPLPKVWTPSIQPTPNAAPPAAAAPSQANGAPGTDQPAYIDTGWAASVSDWLVQHHTFQTDARLRHVQGLVVIRFSVQPDGQVIDVSVLHSSGIRGLDQAAMALVRGARLPPFPPSMVQPLQSVTVPIRYGLE